MKVSFSLFFLAILLGVGCQSPVAEDAVFVLHESPQTGLSFSNELEAKLELNVFNYMYFYNGGGLGAGDLNNDGKIDLFFTANQQANQLFLNQGNLKFKEVTAETGIQHRENTWSNGVSIVDINQDGLLDIYVSEVGEFATLNSRNYLYVCTGIEAGIPKYEEQAAVYGLDLRGFGTQAAFFDYDLDGDLDLFQLNHSLHANGTFGQRKSFLEKKIHPLSGDRLLRNDNGKFVDVTAESGILSNVVGYGLGIAMGDINMDGYPDIYIGNDFHENDYMYLNNGDGTFSEKLTEQIMHTSRFSMGVDVADLNNDLMPEIISLDMLPYDPYILKKSEGEDALGTFNFKLGYGYNHQYARNNLQLNNGNGSFSEIGYWANIFATDWSWSSLFFDIDQDGVKDLFVSNGIPKRMNDMDYINFISNDDVQWKIKSQNMEEKDLELIEKLPEIKLPNKIFLGSDSLRFHDLESQIANNQAGYSNGAIYADLDNDGDLDVVTNNIDAPAFLYENKTAKGDHWIAFNLKGPKGNLQGIGTKAIVYKQDKKMVVEHFPVKGFQSSSLGLLHIGIGDPSTVDSVLLIWPDQRYQKWTGSLQGLVEATYKVELPLFDYQQLKPKPAPVAFDDITEKSGLSYTHQENPFVEFNREPLIPHSTSSEGPALAVGDLNGDGLDDIFLGGSKRKRSALYWQKSNGTFVRQRQNAIDLDSIYEDVDAIILDFNGDGKNDLMVASGGNEYYNESEYLLSRLYLNDGKGNLEKKADAFTGIYATAACLAVKDINGDGHPDVFMGTRAEPWSYGTIPQSYLLINDGTGRFKDASNQYADDLADVGLVTDAKWIDMDGDQKEDLVVATEWGKISAFLHKGSRLERLDLTKKKGLWNTIEAIDFDKDGDMDLIAGNLGKNARLQPKADAPVKMYIHDFDANKKVETILTYHLGGREVIFPNKMELEKQIPPIKKKFLFASDFAKATVEEVMGTDNHTAAQRLNIDYTANSLIVNLGDGTFETRPLPWEAQLSPYKATQVVDINKDGYDDVLVGGNYYDANVQMGRYDADYGTVLLNQAGKGFEVIRAHNLIVKGQVRNIALIRSKGKEVYLLAKNNDAAQLVTIN